jgi:hypothetical protein
MYIPIESGKLWELVEMTTPPVATLPSRTESTLPPLSMPPEEPESGSLLPNPQVSVATDALVDRDGQTADTDAVVSSSDWFSYSLPNSPGFVLDVN